MRPILGATILMALSFPGSLLAADGNELLRNCSAAVRYAETQQISDSDALRAVNCGGYLSGFVDAISIRDRLQGQSSLCLPASGVSNEQAARIVVKYLQNNPEKLHETGRVSLFIALTTAFPCAQQR